MSKMSPWYPDRNPLQARRIGKTTEETAELLGVLGRISIQGIDEIDPASGKTNRQRLHEETADVLAQIRCNIIALQMDITFIEKRAGEKQLQMADWESCVEEQP